MKIIFALAIFISIYEIPRIYCDDYEDLFGAESDWNKTSRKNTTKVKKNNVKLLENLEVNISILS